MRVSGSLTTLALTLAAFSPLTAALNPRQGKAMLVRADPSSSADQSSATDKSTASSGQSASSERPAQTNTAKPPSKTDKGGASTTKSGDNASKTGDSSDGNNDDTETSYPADAGFGAIVMTKPPITAANTPLYRISEYVTLGWNYTALEVPPKAIDVYVTQKDKQATFTLTQNMTFTTAVNFVWNTTEQANDPTNPLFTAEYSLMIKDSAKGFKDTTANGHLFPNIAAFSFGLYQAADYVPLSQYICPGCSGASTLSHSAGLAAVMGLAAAAVGAGIF